MYIVNRKLDRRFSTFEDALKCAVKKFLDGYADDKEPYIIKKTPKGWTVKAKNPLHTALGITYSNMQFIQEI